jgi:nucleoside 2-deoxyribosyltransferase
VDSLYPSKDWAISRSGDSYRPSYVITHKVEPLEVFFGPKITERPEYGYLSWDTLFDQNRPYIYSGTEKLAKIVIPPPHALAYSKLISFISRYANRDKAFADLRDFVNVSNHNDFSISQFWNIVRRNGAADFIRSQVQSLKLDKEAEVLSAISNSSMYEFVKLFDRPTLIPRLHGNAPRKRATARKQVIYLAGPHLNIEINKLSKEALERHGFTVKLPYEEVERVTGAPTPKDAMRVRNVCIDAIRASDAVVVDVDRYGLDTAWEIGFADAIGKPVFGVNLEPRLLHSGRITNRRLYNENFMHGWSKTSVYRSPDELFGFVSGKKIYVCGSFSNESINLLRGQFESRCERIVFPYDYVPEKDGTLPRDYPLHTRETALRQMEECDVLLVVLPRYGMDSSWQIGFAAGKEKQVVGITLPDDCNTGDMKTPWDHWMHGWKERDLFTGLPRLGAGLAGYADAGIF